MIYNGELKKKQQQYGKDKKEVWCNKRVYHLTKIAAAGDSSKAT